MDNFQWRLHFEGEERVLEVNSLTMQVYDAPNGEKSYFFQSPSPHKEDAGRVNLFLYPNKTSIEWVDTNKKLKKSLTIKSRAEITYQDDLLKIWVKSV